MTSVVQLKDANVVPVEDVVAICELALAKAKSGELRSVALVGLVTGNEYWSTFSLEDMIYTLGHLEVIRHDIFEQLGKP